MRQRTVRWGIALAIMTALATCFNLSPPMPASFPTKIVAQATIEPTVTATQRLVQGTHMPDAARLEPTPSSTTTPTSTVAPVPQNEVVVVQFFAFPEGSVAHASAAAIANGHLYVAKADPYGLWAFDLADGEAPRPVGFKEMPGDFVQLTALGNFLIYVAKGGLWMVDVSNPAAPRIESTCCPAGATWLDVQDGLGYMATNFNGLHVLDMADPAHPVEIGVFPSDAMQVEVAVRGPLAYVAEDAKPDRLKDNTWQGGGLRILDVSNPAQPQDLSFVDTPGWVTDMALVGDLVYLAGYGQMRVLDVSDPLEPVEVQVYELPPYANRVVIVTDDEVAVPIGNDLVRFDVPESGVAPGWGVLTRASLGVIAGDLVYVPAGDQGLLVLRLPLPVEEP